MQLSILFILTIIFFSSCEAHADHSSIFTGKKFVANIEDHCDEGNQSCDKISLKSKSIKTNQSINLKGKTINTNCPDVCDFQGYRFTNGEYDYSFYPSLKGNDLWDYIITFKNKVIAQDLGEMK
ncbi:hypothetical protein [Candidatus Pantoea formicae]|uniref:hypothetical protein n=1 Tax=Candidatus Pantoea formicae TaxID=2608355 RepID=UPI00196695FD|nr:hypothetical protein [Pantoea formicae]